jgi:hypothetical protein
MHWNRATLESLSLSSAGSGSSSAAARPSGFRIWNQGVGRRSRAGDRGGPFAELRPVRIVGVRGGTFAGQLVAGSEEPIAGLKASVSDLRGPGTIPASAVKLSYALPDGIAARARQAKVAWFDSLVETPPATVPVANGAAVQPIWISVAVPADARPGLYEGEVSVSARGAAAVRTGLELRVIDWTLPEPRDFRAHLDVAQSPTSLALAYKVPMWSEEHWRLVERSFELLGRMAVKTIYLHAVRETHFGNEHAMVRWKKGAGGKLEPDLSIVERYLDTAVRHLGRAPGVILYLWEPPDSMGHAGSGPKGGHDREILVSVGGGASPEKATGPKPGTPACRAFWKRLCDAVTAALAERGMERSLMFGLIGDHRPTKTFMDDLAAAAPDVKWAVHSHMYCDRWMDHEVGYCSALWGIKHVIKDPDEDRTLGWNGTFWLNLYPRNIMGMQSPLPKYRTIVEGWLGASPASREHWLKNKKSPGVKGVGRWGAEFWPVLEGASGRSSTIAGRYPATYWGQLNLNYCIPAILGRGPRGAVPTLRSESVRENLQEIEAWAFVEETLAAKKVNGDLAARCRRVLDERIRASLLTTQPFGDEWYWGSGWQERNARLYSLAAEVAGKLGK